MGKLSRYYAREASRGVGKTKATLSIPAKLLARMRGALTADTADHPDVDRAPERKGNVVTGFGRLDLPLLASYSRSGTNWIRFILESLSGRPTPGQKRLVGGDDYVVDRAHCAFPVMHSYRRVVLVVRDYRECLLRQHENEWPRYRGVVEFLESTDTAQPPFWYVENLLAFDRFSGDKLLIYYEDLVGCPEDPISKLASFLSLDPSRVEAFLGELETNFERSVNAYVRGGHQSKSARRQDFSYHARTKLSPSQVGEFDDFYASRYPEIANRYLHRYATSSGSPDR